MASIMAATLFPFPLMRRVTSFSGENSAEILNRFRRKRRRKIFKWSMLFSGHHNELMHYRENHMTAS